ncbi:MAG: T9SS type A sorting domain-containing protein [Bacteroidota bacterium]
MTRLKSQLTVLSIIIAHSIFSQGLDYTWAEGTLGSDFQAIANAKTDNFGNTYVLGYHRNTEFTIGGESVPYLGSTLQEGHLVKITPNGEVEWTKSFGQLMLSGYNMEDLAIDEFGNVYWVGNVLAFFTAPVIDGIEIPMYGNFIQGIIVKINPDGTTEWIKGVLSENVTAALSKIDRIDIDSSGNLVMIGTFTGQLDMDGDILTSSGDTEDAFIAKADSDGNLLWGFSFGSEFGRNIVGDIVANSDDEIFVSTVWTGNSIVVGNFTEENPDAEVLSNYDRLIAKFSSDGTPIWTSREGSVEEDFITELVADDEGGVISVAESQGEITINETNYDISGTFLSVYNFEGGSASVTQISTASAYIDLINPTYPIGIARDGSGNLVVMITSTDESVDIGGITLANSGGDFGTYDIFLASIAPNGTANWAQVIGTDDNEYGEALSPNGNGGYLIGGDFFGFDLTIGDFVLENAGFPERSYFITSTDEVLSVFNQERVQPLSVYPNPATDRVIVDIPVGTAPDQLLSVFDMMGKKVHEQRINQVGKMEVELGSLPNGIYSIAITGAERVYSTKLIVSN